MKKLLIIPALLLVAGSFFLTSCGNAPQDAALKAPVQNNADTAIEKSTNESAEQEAQETEGKEKGEQESEKNEKGSIVKPISYVSGADAGSKTVDNMKAAFKGETTASAKYAAYSKKAEQEGYHQVALLFKAASTAENIHANNHRAVLQESGAAVPVIKPEFTVKTTKENLQDAIAGETYEVVTMYPEFLVTANSSGDQLATMSLNYAYKTEKKHKTYYENALTALLNNNLKSLPVVFYICPTCGNTYETKAPGRCGISMTAGNRFIKISSL